MTRRTRRLIGRAHRRKAQGVPVTSIAVFAAYTQDQFPTIREAFQALVDRVRTAWDTIRASVLPALRSTPGLQLPPPPVRRRTGGPLIHNGRKPR